MSFSLETFTEVAITSVNIRAENHGNEPVPAADIGMELVCSNAVLDQFDAGLKSVLYRASDEYPAQPGLDGVEDASDMPQLRSTSILMPICLGLEYVGRNLVIDYGLGGKSNIELSGIDVNKFQITALEGGSVKVKFRVQASGLDGPVLGKLGALIKHKVHITLLSSPEADGSQESLLPKKTTTVGHAGSGKVTNISPAPTGDAPDAGDIFSSAVAAGHTTPATVVPITKPKKAKARSGKGG